MARRRPLVDGAAGRPALLRRRLGDRRERGRVPRGNGRKVVYPTSVSCDLSRANAKGQTSSAENAQHFSRLKKPRVLDRERGHESCGCDGCAEALPVPVENQRGERRGERLDGEEGA